MDSVHLTFTMHPCVPTFLPPVGCPLIPWHVSISSEGHQDILLYFHHPISQIYIWCQQDTDISNMLTSLLGQHIMQSKQTAVIEKCLGQLAFSSLTALGIHVVWTSDSDTLPIHWSLEWYMITCLLFVGLWFLKLFCYYRHHHVLCRHVTGIFQYWHVQCT